MSSDPRLCAMLVVLAGCAPGAHSLSAQQSPGISCEAAKSSLSQAGHLRDYRNTLKTLARCGDQGVNAIAAEWSTPPEDSGLVVTLAGISSLTRDERVYTAVRHTALEAANSEQVRLAALKVLVSYFDPSIGIEFRAPPVPTESGAAYVLIGRYDHPKSVVAGDRPLPAGVREEVLQILQELAAAEDNGRLGKVAQYLGVRLKKGDI